jgi:hypothetical protein
MRTPEARASRRSAPRSRPSWTASSWRRRAAIDPAKGARRYCARKSSRAFAGCRPTGSRSTTLHRVDPETALEESLRTIEEYRDSGKIRHVGLSEVGVEQIERAREVVPIAAVQNHYNLSERRWDDVVDYCAREGIGFVPFFPLGGDGGGPLAEIARRHGAYAGTDHAGMAAPALARDAANPRHALA